MKKNEVAKAILYTIAGIGLIVVAISAPNVIGVFGRYYRTKRFSKRQIYNSLWKLKQNSLVSIKEQKGKTIVELTKNGKHKVLKYKLDDLIIQKSKKWDHKWRLVIFDVPEKFRISRIYFAAKLKSLGFLALQKSVWVYPYACENEIDFLKEIFEIREYVRLVTAVSVEYQEDLVKEFSLSS